VPRAGAGACFAREDFAPQDFGLDFFLGDFFRLWSFLGLAIALERGLPGLPARSAVWWHGARAVAALTLLARQWLFPHMALRVLLVLIEAEDTLPPTPLPDFISLQEVNRRFTTARIGMILTVKAFHRARFPEV